MMRLSLVPHAGDDAAERRRRLNLPTVLLTSLHEGDPTTWTIRVDSVTPLGWSGFPTSWDDLPYVPACRVFFPVRAWVKVADVVLHRGRP